MIGTHTVWVTPADTPAGTPLDITCYVETISLNYGRGDVTGSPEAATATLDLDLADTTLPAVVDIGAAVKIETSLAGDTSTRFVGRVTDIGLGWDDTGAETPNSGTGQLVAVAGLADLGRRVVGDQPWPAELDGARVARILTLAGVTVDPGTSDPGTVQVLARDVDARDALGLAKETAQSGDGMVWQTRAGSIRYADAQHRRNTIPALDLDTCQLAVSPAWLRSLEGMVNKISVGYGVAAEGSEQPRYVASNAASIARYGTYDYSVTTMLAGLADAQALAGLLLARNSRPVWVLQTLPVAVEELSAADTAALLDLELHDLISLTGLPDIGDPPTTAALWVEGWTETLGWGIHELDLVVSGYCRTVPPPLWDDIEATLTWNAAAGSWDDAACIGPQPAGDTWADVPASQRWNQTVDTMTWDTWKVS